MLVDREWLRGAQAAVESDHVDELGVGVEICNSDCGERTLEAAFDLEEGLLL